MSDYKSSLSASFARYVRSAVRASDLTRAERDITLAVINLWFHHKEKGYIFPGREKLAKKGNASVRTVASTLSMLRAAGVLTVISHAKGGRASTRYKVRFSPLLILCGCDLPEWMEGELKPIIGAISSQNCTLLKPEIARFTHAKIAHGSKRRFDDQERPIQDLSFDGDDHE